MRVTFKETGKHCQPLETYTTWGSLIYFNLVCPQAWSHRLCAQVRKRRQQIEQDQKRVLCSQAKSAMSQQTVLAKQQNTVEKAGKKAVGHQPQDEHTCLSLSGQLRGGQGCDQALRASGQPAVCPWKLVRKESPLGHSLWISSRQHDDRFHLFPGEPETHRQAPRIEMSSAEMGGNDKEQLLSYFWMSEMHLKWIFGNIIRITVEIFTVPLWNISCM